MTVYQNTVCSTEDNIHDFIYHEIYSHLGKNYFHDTEHS